MKKINVEATRLNNEDVIATSGAVCKDKYHIVVATVNWGGGSNEACYLYKEDASGYLVEQEDDTVPAELSTAFSQYYPGGSALVDLGTPSVGDVFYWDGSQWQQCNDHTIDY